MVTQCFTPIRGRRMRLTELDECGNVASPGLYVVSEGFITVTLSVELESGDEYIQKNASGKLCVNERNPDSLKRLNVEVDYCAVDPDAVSIVTGFPQELDDDTDPVGFRIKEGELEARYALEVWTDLAGNVCDEEGNKCYGYTLVPQITGSAIGDIVHENANLTFQTTGYTLGHSGWGTGPWNVIGNPAGPLTEGMAADEHALLRTTCVAPPPAVCGAQDLPGSS